MQTIEELTLTALSLVFLLLGVVLIASIVFTAFNPYEQVAIANTRKMAAIMNQACVAGEGSAAIEFDFDLQQNVPIGSNFLTVLPKWLMRNYGDPNFVMYYESFPPGEGIGWETYHQFDHRLYIILDNSFDGKGIDSEVDPYVMRRIDEFQRQNPDKILEGTVVANIMLNDLYKGITTEKKDKSKEQAESVLGKKKTIEPGGGGTGGGGASGELSPEKLFFGFGVWDSRKNIKEGTTEREDFLYQEDFFHFKNYRGLTSVEKTLIKYESCGPNSLCLKTRSGVYRFPLNNCAGKIKTAQLVYDVRNRKTVYGGVIAAAVVIGLAGPEIAAVGSSISGFLSKLGSVFRIIPGSGALITVGKVSFVVDVAYKGAEWFAVAMLGLKTGNLALASPCHIDSAQVYISSCTIADIPNSLNYKPCASYIKYPIFNVNKETKKLSIVKKDGNIIYHYECADKLETKPDRKSINNVVSSDPNSYKNIVPEENKDGACLQVRIFERPEGFCWTPDPSTTDFNLDNDDTKGFADVIKFTPVRNAVEYVPSTQDISLRPTRSEDLEGFMSKVGKTFGWGWPFANVRR
ncbi:MAG: hypothetical protein HY514_00395 [Candidatus Aenigmarchaeota archaeon]|nr:hypothetical protein [Candidatus Aenigmarchaeota archaeon]